MLIDDKMFLTQIESSVKKVFFPRLHVNDSISSNHLKYFKALIIDVLPKFHSEPQKNPGM